MNKLILTSVSVSVLISVFYYNFPLPDFEACTPARLVDIVAVMAYELSKGEALFPVFLQ